ncbi:hypothetical protein [Pedobacter sp. SYSU D00535]|uniref:hypothetical protein n=1 Tax=Pedobacter sp. SYSU D00535 TaxID=2810308 RepID=UPI001A9659A5|nr:hypothetical protein [Pedobacter sp. SYSU D00535]
MEISYTPVAWDYREQIEEAINKKSSGKIFYFAADQTVAELSGGIREMQDQRGKGVFIHLEPSGSIRIDRIITLFGKPAAAYDEYDAFANACLDCMGGYDKDQLDAM